MRSRVGFWRQVLGKGAASVNSAVGWFGSIVVILGVAAGVAVPQVVHVSHWLTAVIVLAVVLVVVLEGSYRVWDATDGKRREALDSARQQPSPVPGPHGEQLRAVARRLGNSLEAREALDYGPDDQDMWRSALLEHFPGLEAVLENAVEKDTAFESLKDRLRSEATAAGLDRSPWTAEKFLPRLATTIQARALTNILGSAFDFDWQVSGHGDLYLGDWLHGGVQVLDDRDPDVMRQRMEEFQAFFKRVESSPEAAAIRRAWNELDATRAAALKQLAAAANTDPITSRCFLCGGSTQPVEG